VPSDCPKRSRTSGHITPSIETGIANDRKVTEHDRTTRFDRTAMLISCDGTGASLRTPALA